MAYTHTQIYTEQELRSRRLAMHFEDNDNDSDEYEARPSTHNGPPISLTTEGHCDRLVLMSVLAPIGHTYVTVAEALETLVGTAVTESEFVCDCVQRIQAKVDSNLCRYGEFAGFLCCSVRLKPMANISFRSQPRAYPPTRCGIASNCWTNGTWWRCTARPRDDSCRCGRTSIR